MQPTITKVNPRTGTVTVKMEDRRGKAVEKSFQLTDDIEYLDSTGRVATLDVFQCGDEVLIIEIEGKIKELKRATPAPSGPTQPKTTAQPAVASGGKGHNTRSICPDDIRLRAVPEVGAVGEAERGRDPVLARSGARADALQVGSNFLANH